MNVIPYIHSFYADCPPDLSSLKIRLERIPHDRIRAGPIDFDLLFASRFSIQQVTAFFSHRLAHQLSIPINRIDLITLEDPSSFRQKTFYLIAHLQQNRILTEEQAMAHYTNSSRTPPVPLPDFLDI